MGQYVCNKCNTVTVEGLDDEGPDDIESGCQCECGNEMTWASFDTASDRKVDSEFDFVMQVWRDSTGEVIEEEDEWSHVCDFCHGPAEIISIDAYGERHKCLNCGHHFTVS